MQNSIAEWASRNWAAYSPAVATRPSSRASTDRSRSNANIRSFRDPRPAISALADGRPLSPSIQSEIATQREDVSRRNSCSLVTSLSSRSRSAKLLRQTSRTAKKPTLWQADSQISEPYCFREPNSAEFRTDVTSSGLMNSIQLSTRSIKNDATNRPFASTNAR